MIIGNRLLHDGGCNRYVSHEFIKKNKLNGICLNCKGGTNAYHNGGKGIYCNECDKRIGVFI